jgi:DNA-binding MarR family transcriptional regulator
VSPTPDPGGDATPDLDRLVHEPARLVLMTHLYVVEEADFVYLARRTGLTAGNISSHMSRLEEAGYVHITKTITGTRPRTVYALTAAGRAAFDRYRDQVDALLDATR